MSIQEAMQVAWQAFRDVRDEEIEEELLKSAEYQNHRDTRRMLQNSIDISDTSVKRVKTQ